MLHMAVIKHGPDTCAAVHADIGDLAREGFGALETIGANHQVKIHGAWGNAPGHTFFVLLDAADAHAVNEVMIEAKIFHWNSVDVHAVKTVEDMMPLAAGG